MLLCWGFADMNLGTPLLQCQVPTWLGESEYVKPNHTPPRVYPVTKKDNLAMIIGRKHAQVKRKRASWRANPPHQKTKLQRSIYHEHKMKQKLSENVRIHHRQV